MSVIVEVTWLDSVHQEELPGRKLATLKPLIFKSYGVLLREDEEQVTIAGSICHEEDEGETTYRDCLCVPRSCVLNIAKLCENST